MTNLPPVSSATLAALGAPAPALRACATRCGAPDVSNAAFTLMSGWTRHLMTDDVQSFQVVYPNWIAVTSSNEGETGIGALTLTAALEYPIGTFTRITFGGAGGASAPSGAQIISDPVKVAIKKGATFRLRYFYSNPGGILFDCRQGPGELMCFGTSGLTDMTMGGTPSGGSGGGSGGVGGAGGSQYSYRPVAIVGLTTRKAILAIGDSRFVGFPALAAGVQDVQSDVFGGLGVFERSFCRGEAGCVLAARGGELASDFLAGHANRLALAAYCDIVVGEYGLNDLFEGASQATAESRISAIAALFPGKPVYWTTILPDTTSTDAWATTGNQTKTLGANDAYRTGLNDDLRAGAISGLSGFIELADVVESARDSGLWVPGCTSDGIHANQAGCEAIRKAGWPWAHLKTLCA
jgi:hypothetical protein